MEEQEKIETGLVKVAEFKELISKAPAVLEENKTSFQKAATKGVELIELAGKGMNDVIDKELSDYIDKAKKTVIVMTDRRKPFTQIMTMVAKEFTTLEGALKPTIDQCQEFRNKYATKKMEERKELERLAALKLAKENEAIELVKYYKIQQAGMYSDFLLKFKTDKTDWFNSLTLENVEGAEKVIQDFNNNLSDSMFNFRIPTPTTMLYHTETDYFGLINELMMSSCYAAMAQFKNDIVAFMREMTDLIPSKKEQLMEIEIARLAAIKAQEEERERQRRVDILARWAKRKSDREADAEKKAKLEQEAIEAANKAEIARQEADAAELKRQADKKAEDEKESERQKEVLEKLQSESDELKLKAESQAQVQATGEKAGAMVDTQADLFNNAPKVKEGYLIKILNPAAYLLLAQFWFENEGKTQTVEKIEAMTFARIKVFCEKWAAKNEEFIESKMIIYEPIYKAK